METSAVLCGNVVQSCSIRKTCLYNRLICTQFYAISCRLLYFVVGPTTSSNCVIFVCKCVFGQRMHQPFKGGIDYREGQRRKAKTQENKQPAAPDCIPTDLSFTSPQTGTIRAASPNVLQLLLHTIYASTSCRILFTIWYYRVLRNKNFRILHFRLQ